MPLHSLKTIRSNLLNFQIIPIVVALWIKTQWLHFVYLSLVSDMWFSDYSQFHLIRWWIVLFKIIWPTLNTKRKHQRLCVLFDVEKKSLQVKRKPHSFFIYTVKMVWFGSLKWIMLLASDRSMQKNCFTMNWISRFLHICVVIQFFIFAANDSFQWYFFFVRA